MLRRAVAVERQDHTRTDVGQARSRTRSGLPLDAVERPAAECRRPRRQLLAGPDSTPPDDAVATMDTVTLIRSAVRGVLAVADAPPRSSGLAQPAVLAAHGLCALGPFLGPLWRIQHLRGVK